jgi:BarA-like signal transduction histidine kinase
MVQPDERMTERLTVHIYPSVKARLDRAVAASPWDQPDWIRHLLDETLLRLELEELAGSDVTKEAMSDAPLAVQLAAAQAQIAGLEQVVALLRERLGLADAHNIALNQRLEESLSAVDKVMLALPPPTYSDAGPTRRSWQFWKR